ncbi:hypothetical protein RFI_26771 [Reticulomyxa filosa]|uniref:Uncharacterized protein n=1 Tax=Reticulomyxa filosa TaxID=46433 RepID=X6MAA7_RETFI|nr:hypothetical protein RFI_26771 [Reticulomyxa filosa]|eukprot:ETO10606.1 hypothetical protein RFI_26771 [Reticulomyxa filosa]
MRNHKTNPRNQNYDRNAKFIYETISMRSRKENKIAQVLLQAISKCFKLNHTAKECQNKRKTCKYCGLKNYKALKCRYKNDLSLHRCVLCKKNHLSDSVQCEVIRNAREKLGIKLTRKENAILQKEALHSQLIQIKKKSDNVNHVRHPVRRPQNNNQKDADEILSLRREIEDMKAAFKEITTLMRSFKAMMQIGVEQYQLLLFKSSTAGAEPPRKWNLYRQIIGMKLEEWKKTFGIGKTKYWNKNYLEMEQALVERFASGKGSKSID